MICAPFNFLPSLAAVLLLAAGSPPLQAQDSTPRDQIYYFPHLAVGASWQTTITYINYSPQEVTCQTDFISDHGTPVMVSFAGLGTVDSRTDVLPPGGSVHQETDVALSAPLARGWARATCSGPVQASLLFRGYNSEGMPVAEAGVNAATVPATRFVTFAEQGEDQFGTGVAYANPSPNISVPVTFTARDAAGEVLASVVRTLLPGGHDAHDMAELFGLSSFSGSIEVTSTEPIFSLSLNFEAAPVFSSLPPGELDAAAQGSTTYYFPHLAVGASWQTTITYINYSREEVTCQTDFISDHGSPLMVSFAELGTVVSRTDVLPPGGSVHQETDVALSAPLARGWARATCSGPVQASLLYRQHNSEGMPVAEAGVNAATVAATRFVTFAEQGEGKDGTGVAYANPFFTSALVTFTARDADGEVLAIEDLMLPPNGHGAQNMPTLFDLSSFTGSLEVTSTVPIVSLSLNFEATPVFSSLPPGDIPGEMLAPTDEAAFNDLFVGKRATTNYPTVYVDFVSPGRFRETEGSDIWTGSYTYRNTGPNTGTVTFNYDNGDRCVASFTFVSTTAGTATYTCNEGSSGGSNWLLVAISATGTPDLVVQTPSVSDSNPNAGESFTLSAAVRNQGNGLSASTTLRYYRSTDATINTGDTEVGTDAVSALTPAGTSDESISLTAPTTAGTYYYGACVDRVSGESNTQNNCSNAVALTLSASHPDHAALVALFEATGGPNWTNNDNWLSDAPLGDWHGVQVDSEGRVWSLFLSANALAGSIPPELGNLTRLRTLRLTGTADPNVRFRQVGDGLTGPIPPELGNLSELRVLALSGNNLTDSIPSELGNLSELRGLSLSSNNLTGPIPGELGDLSNLGWLWLSGNDFSTSIPPELGKLSNLTFIRLGNAGLTGPIPGELGRLSNLTTLILERNDLRGPIPSELGRLANLDTLDLGRNGLSGPIPTELGRLPQLLQLLLSNNELTGPVPDEFGALATLEVLELTNNAGMSGALPSSLTSLGRLEALLAVGTGLCSPTNPGFVTWLEGIPKQRIASCADTGASQAYLIQVAQSREFPVPLVANRQALLRVFPTAREATGDGIPRVRASFYLNGTPAHVVDIPAKSTAIPTEVHEGSLATSANAEIPASVMQPGLEMVVEIDPDGTLDATLGVTKRIPETGRMAIDVRAMPTLDMTLVPFLWSAKPDSSILDIVEGLSPEDEVFRMTRTLLPVGDFDLRVHEPVLTSTNNVFAMSRENRAIWVMEGRRGHYVGTIAGEFTGPRGGGSLDTRTMFTVLGPTIGDYEYVMAHELGHTMNLLHTPCGGANNQDQSYPYSNGSIGVWGYDFRNGGSLVAPHNRDLMSYCGRGVGWISDYHFTNALRYRLFDESPPAEAIAASSKSLLLWGGMDPEGEPFLEPAFVVDAPAALPDSAGEYRVTGRTASGGELFSLSFTMPETADGDGSSSFVFALPVQPGWAENLSSVTLAGPEGSASLDGDSDRPMVILRNPRTGQVRGFLRDLPPATQAAKAAEDAARRTAEAGLEMLFSRGIPDAESW